MKTVKELAQMNQDDFSSYVNTLSINEAKTLANDLGLETKKLTRERLCKKIITNLEYIAADLAKNGKAPKASKAKNETAPEVETAEPETAPEVETENESNETETAETAIAVIETEIVTALPAEVLTADEAETLEKCETTILLNIDNFFSAAASIGSALTTINTRRLYRQTHKTFEAYVTEKFNVSRPHAYQLMQTGAVYEALNDDQAEKTILPSIRASLVVAKQVKGLLPDFADENDVQNVGGMLTRETWKLIVETAPLKNGKPDVTPAHIDQVFKTLRDVIKTDSVEVDGESVHVTPESFNESVTDSSIERVQAKKAKLAQSLDETKKRLNEPQKREASGKSLADLTGADNETENESNAPKTTLAFICSEHGEQELSNFISAGLVLKCGCKFVDILGKGLTFVGSENLT